jgi:hypothetical protein
MSLKLAGFTRLSLGYSLLTIPMALSMRILDPSSTTITSNVGGFLEPYIDISSLPMVPSELWYGIMMDKNGFMEY